MLADAVQTALTPEQLEQYNRDGFVILRGLFSREECKQMIQEVMDLHTKQAIPGYEFVTAEQAGGDPLKQFSRIMHPHRFHKLSLDWLVDSRVADVLRVIYQEEPVAAQSMFYFKPPGARGQAFHQDNYYLRVKPKSCVAAWIALDEIDEQNGGLQVVPGTQNMEVACPQKADLTISFSQDLVPPPAGKTPVPANMQPGDTLFFNGSVVHGSTPNSSKERWRRSFISHYGPASMKEITEWYFPILDMTGKEVPYPKAEGGGPCGSAPKEAH